MASTDLISNSLMQSFANVKSGSDINEDVSGSILRILNNDIEYVDCAEYSTSNFMESIRNKYDSLENVKLKKKKNRKRNKHKSCNNTNSLVEQMRNTELNVENESLPVPQVVLFSPENIRLGWKGPVPIGCGFINLGTTCYINSTLQALFHVPAFVNWLLNDKNHHTACEKINGMLHTECVVCAMLKTLQISHRSSGSIIRPKFIIEKVKTICKHLSPFRQEDAHEFLRYLLEAMERSYITILGISFRKFDCYSKETTPLNQIFGGYIRTEVTCSECNYVSTTFQHFQDLILDIRQGNTSTVYDALENYFSNERLEGDDSYHCEQCKKKVSAYKKFSIEKAPNVLCIQLKRFNINNYCGGSKISKLITTPNTIDLTKFKHTKDKCTELKYRLVSMVFHHGPTANSGHYTALGSTASGTFYFFNDDHVYVANSSQYTNNPNVYIMFYELEKQGSITKASYELEKQTTITKASYELEKPSTIPKDSYELEKQSSTAKTSVVKSETATITYASVVSNGSLNSTVKQRNNGFIIKRENGSSSSMTNSKQPSWKINNNEKNTIKSIIKPLVPTLTRSTSTSLVPYMSSDSESSDNESGKCTDANNNSHNSRSAVNDSDDKNKFSSSSTLSSLAKKNSTLTSLLSSSPQNDNCSYRVSSSSKSSLSNSKPLRLDVLNHNDDENDTIRGQNTVSSELKTEKRNLISFNMFNRDKKKGEYCEMKYDGVEGKKNNENTKSTKQTVVGVATMYFSGKEMKKESYFDENKDSKSSESIARNSDVNYSRTNVIINGGSDQNGVPVVNGANNDTKPVTNGWIVSEIEGNNSYINNTDVTQRNDTRSCRNEWVIREKGNRKMTSSPVRDNKLHESRENLKKCNGVSNDTEYDSCTRNDFQSINKNFTYSSQNGYGGKVFTWKGDLSYINKETELQRKEATKRSYCDYDDEMDRGKVKKSKHYNRNESGTNFQSPRKNLVQQYQNNYNRNKRSWHLNQNSHHYNSSNNSGNGNSNYNRRYANNGFHRHNYYGYRHVNFVHQNSWRR